jgi:2-hydroxychromene-2-carboxylate isomerase
VGRLDFFFDPGCPWTWITARWVAEVAPQRDIQVTWRPFSLTLKNEGQELPPGLPDALRDRILGLRPVTLAALRVLEAVRDAHGDAPIGNLYLEYGRRIHHDESWQSPDFLADSLTGAGLDPSLATASDDATWDARLRAELEAAVEVAGADVGSPILVFDTEPRRGFHGPVLSPAPTGDDALRLWDAVRVAVDVPGLFELKRSRTTGPQLPARP